jgi:NAD(P)-dependent dehydrogenase (short-subunit alcohol dehydrogenase family)
MASAGVILILGAGPRLGRAVASKFASNGYKVALAARSISDGISPEGFLNIKTDLSDPTSVPMVFEAVEKSFGLPNIVVYNGSKTPPYFVKCLPKD